MQPTIYSIPTCFIEKFHLEDLCDSLSKDYPQISIEKRIAPLATASDYKNLKELYDRIRLLPDSNNSPLKEIMSRLNRVVKILNKEQPSRDNTTDFDPEKAPGKIAHNTKPNSCYVAVLLNTLRDEFFKDVLSADPELQLFLTCIERINQGSKVHLNGYEEGVVTVDEIAGIQKILTDKKLLRQDGITDQDPMEVLGNLLEKINSNFSLIKGEEINQYCLNQSSEEVGLNPNQVGQNGVIIVDQNGETRRVLSEISIPLTSTNSSLFLDEALANYFDDKQPSEKTTVYVKTSTGTYLKYTDVRRTIKRILSEPPERLFLEISDHSKKSIFKEQIRLKMADGTEHYYVLQQINCHIEAGAFKHEYAYINHQSEWFLSDDLRPIKRAFLKAKSEDVNDISKHGRVFIYRKVDFEVFKKISDKAYSYFQPITSQTKVTDSLEPFVLTQLKGLRAICQKLASPKASIQDLFELSWGVANLPKECKFSKTWLSFIPESHWLLLEDISRQLSLKYPNHLQLSDFHTKESMKQLVLPFSNTAKQLADIFDALQKNLPQEKPIPLSQLENLFYEGFDEFILGHVQKAVKTIQEAYDTKEPLDWLKEDENHFKALFRVVEIIGEASKIVSQKAKKMLPILSLCSKDDKGLLWGRLRNQLHHKKSRSWDIARLAPEKWVTFVSKLFPKLTSQGVLPTDEDLRILEELLQGLNQDQYNEIRKDWRKIENSDFEREPLYLKKILFGFELNHASDFNEIWEKHAKPFLKNGIDETKNKNLILELYLIGQKKYILPSDIEKLADSTTDYTKSSAVTKLKELLAAIKSDNDFEMNRSLAKRFEEISRQFVFLKKKDAKNLIRDAQQNKKLKTVVSLKLSQMKTIQFSESFFKDYKTTFVAFIRLKQTEITDTIERLREILKAVKSDWSIEINESNLKNFKAQINSNEPPKDPRRGIYEIWDKLDKLTKFVSDENLDIENELKVFEKSLKEDLLSFSKQFPKEISQETIEKLQQDKDKCLEAISKLEKLLNDKCNNSFIEFRAKERLKEAIVLFKDVKSTPTSISRIKKIFKRFAFPVNTDLKKKLISHNLTDESLDLSSFSSSVITYLDALTEKDLNQKIDELVEDAENEIGIGFIQKVLQEGKISGQFGEFAFQTQLSVLEDIYNSSSKNNRHWKNFVRKIEGRRLTADQMDEILDLKANTTEQPLKDLKDYLNGNKSFDLNKETPRFEHGNKKIEIFRTFLHNECFPVHPQLEDKKALIIKYFKIANRIVDNKADSFSKYFIRKINKLGTVFSEILNKERPSASSNRKGLLSLAAEYDMQDIGELAQLITDRPALWDQGKHILSSQHLMYISLLRKTMAHYPLSLAPELLRWNLEYLSFDTRNMLNRNSSLSLMSTDVKSTGKRRLISWKDIHDMRFDIENYLDNLSLSLTIDVLYPYLDIPENEHLHWLGDLALLVYPKVEMQTKEKFVHAVMELELILCFEFQAKVSVVGKWKDEIINKPYELSISKSAFDVVLEKRQSLYDWELSMHTYDIFLNEPWFQIYLKSGEIIQRSDYELYQGWKFFFEMLELTDSNSIENFLNIHNLFEHVYNCVKKEYEKKEKYSESNLFKWVCCLFEKFPVPGVTPLQLISFPKIEDDERPLTAIIDNTYHCLLSLPVLMNHEIDHVQDSDVSEIQPYYREGVRLDFYNDRSVIESSQDLTNDELIALSVYAVKVLTSHSKFIMDHFKKQYQLDRAQFVDVDGIIVGDPGLIKPVKPIEDISSVENLIKAESKSLSSLIIPYIHSLYLQDPKIYSQMLKWMHIDKEIEVIAADYYGKNRFRLKGPYIQMDSLSRKMFDDVFIKSDGNLWSHFPMVNSFRQFINKIHLETNSLKVNGSSDQIRITGDFSEEFKRLVPEIDIQKSLLDLMKERERIMADFSNFRFIPKEFFNRIYSKWDQLFRMVRDPKTFEFLEKNLHRLGRPKCIKEFQSVLENDLAMQYRKPPADREMSTAKTSDKEVELFEVRSYFDGKLFTEQVKNNHSNLMKLIKASAHGNHLCEEWVQLYGEPMKPIYYDNLIEEARMTINKIIHSSELDTHDFDSVCTFSQYWKFIEENADIRMHSTVISSGVTPSFKKYILEGKTLHEIKKNPEKQKALESDRRLHRIVEAYMDFCLLENNLYDTTYYFKTLIEKSIQTKEDILHAEGAKSEPWMIEEHKYRLGFTKKSIESTLHKMEGILSKIINTQFFKMLKLREKIKHFSNTEGEILTESDQEKLALEGLLYENFDLNKLVHVLEIENISVGPLFKLFYKYN